MSNPVLKEFQDRLTKVGQLLVQIQSEQIWLQHAAEQMVKLDALSDSRDQVVQQARRFEERQAQNAVPLNPIEERRVPADHSILSPQPTDASRERLLAAVDGAAELAKNARALAARRGGPVPTRLKTAQAAEQVGARQSPSAAPSSENLVNELIGPRGPLATFLSPSAFVHGKGYLGGPGVDAVEQYDEDPLRTPIDQLETYPSGFYLSGPSRARALLIQTPYGPVLFPATEAPVPTMPLLMANQAEHRGKFFALSDISNPAVVSHIVEEVRAYLDTQNTAWMDQTAGR